MVRNSQKGTGIAPSKPASGWRRLGKNHSDVPAPLPLPSPSRSSPRHVPTPPHSPPPPPLPLPLTPPPPSLPTSRRMTSIRTCIPALIDKALADAGNDWINTPYEYGRTPIYYVIDCSRWKPELIKSVGQLIAARADLEHKDDDGVTALMYAAKLGQKKIVDLLLKKGALIDTQDNHGNTALTIAAYNGYKATVQLLLDNGASINITNNNGDTALMLAAYKGYKEPVQLLLDKGASINIMNKHGNTALMLAAFQGEHEIVNILKNAKSKLLAQEHSTLLQTLHLPSPATNRTLPEQYESYFILSHGTENIVNFSERKYKVPPNTYIVTFASADCLTYTKYVTDRLNNPPINLEDFPSARIYRPGFKFPVLLASFNHSKYEIENSKYYKWGVYKDKVPNPVYTSTPVQHKINSLWNLEIGNRYDVFELIGKINSKIDPENTKVKVYFYTGCRGIKTPVTEPELQEVRDRSYSQQRKNSNYSSK